ncbi:MAG: hypothetical protein ABJF10_10225 [Chthoniobacter sp.]|uniref:hypothetical protein n=1 Tax=Chthoniobacter sp. TaxID=2510640 RepID=UPI0032A258DE
MVLFLSLAATLHACSVPVFRYALDRWPADAYGLEVSVDDAKDEAVARFLRNFTDSTPLNLAPVRSNETSPSRLTFPHAAEGAAPMWSDALGSSTLPLLTDSPARTELAHRILAGETAVWLLVESGDRQADDRAAAALEKRLHYLEQAADIPQIDPDDPSSELGPGPVLRVKFSLLRVHWDDAAEQPFLKMLAGPKHDTAPSTGPWLALVFGRGRVLGAWPAEGFGDEQIDEACMFLLGACSCQVKRMNPGWDLLLNVDWDGALQAIGYPKNAEAPTEVVRVSNPAFAKPLKVETVTMAAIAPAKTALPANRDAGRTAGFAAVVMLLLGSALAWRTMRGQP